MLIELNPVACEAENGLDDGLGGTWARAESSQVTTVAAEAGKIGGQTNSRDDAAVWRAGREEKINTSRHRRSDSKAEGETAEDCQADHDSD